MVLLLCLVEEQKTKMANHGLSIIPIHCIVHQQNLCAKSVNINNAKIVVVEKVNIIRAKGLNHSQFRSFLHDLGSEYGDVPYHCEVHWLSRGKVLECIFDLREEIAVFLEMKHMPICELSDGTWICHLDFLTDIT